MDPKEKNKGGLPSKQQILQFIRTNKMESLKDLFVDGKYWKVRTKLFNDRKTLRVKRDAKLKEIIGTKEK